ncbi:MAG: alpha/beta fold hydrolase, partial [Candidatus Kapabacteria bacterium]|nr:alpha/beta fold hydrolase [Candidatus Kapabacteria bacterium]
MKSVSKITLVIFGVLFSTSLFAQNTPQQAKAFIEHLKDKKYKESLGFFSPGFAKLVTEEKIKLSMQSIEQMNGAIKSIGDDITSSTRDTFTIYAVPVEFEKASVTFRVTLQTDGKVAGFFLDRPKEKIEQALVINAFVNEQLIAITNGNFTLTGIYTKPVGKTNFPVVVLVHGSGPNDKNETIGPNKPFRDIALGLAKRGVGVIRYDKRTFMYANDASTDTNGITVFDETINDAIAALQFAKTMQGVDTNAVYLCGHSLGGMCAPYISAKATNIAGAIILAGSPRPLEDVILDQMKYLLGNDAESKKQLQVIEKRVKAAKSPTLTTNTSPETLPLNLPGNYWLSLREMLNPKHGQNVPQSVRFFIA